jgi:uncharacterized protein YegL
MPLPTKKSISRQTTTESLTELPTPPPTMPPPRQPLPCEVHLNSSNRSARTLFAWLLDPSPSVQSVMEQQLESQGKLARQLLDRPETARSVMINTIQMGDPTSVMTGFHELATYEAPAIHPCNSTPLHRLIQDAGDAFGSAIPVLREHGLDRTVSIALCTSDGGANGCSGAELLATIKQFHQQCDRWSIVPIAVAVGDQLNIPVLKAMTTTVPPIQLSELNIDLLLPFIMKIVTRASQSSRTKEFSIELPVGMTAIQ